MKVAPTLTTTVEAIEETGYGNTKYCQYSRQYKNALNHLNNVENYLDADVSSSIKKASSCLDYYKNYGYFFTSKTS